ncbi:DUF4406 domain-containing protein [Aurantibacillus circumpalustris]|uniref:DUF4406 domain-containing protein n=1 Tax=Aurantibacillus circumpalustris TaxID=3036359 RepID=UPI00295B1BBF|nr:DUF4406 domain-containing protein [Aurantibacillus circumpalustris]
MTHKRTLLVYLSGKITGLKDLNKPKFRAAERLILDRLQYRDFFVHVFNPHDLPDDHDKQWHSYMRECIKALVCSNKIYVLDDWTKSKGALTEVLIAKILGMPMYSVDTMEVLQVSYSYLFTKLLFKL